MNPELRSTFYRMVGPTQRAKVPPRLSFSSLKDIEECPRRFVLMHSTYGPWRGCPRREAEAALMGSLVHELLDTCFKALALAGLPPLDTEEFATAIATLGVRNTIEARVGGWGEDQADNPRAQERSIRTTPREIYNLLARHLRALYADVAPDVKLAGSATTAMQTGSTDLLVRLRQTLILTELELIHPVLPFRGFADYVALQNAGIVVGDFKTGAERPDHQAQVELYGLLWWRQTGAPPTSLEVRYPKHVARFSIQPEALSTLEDALSARVPAALDAIASVATEARVGAHCRYCQARAFCAEFWETTEVPLPTTPRADLLVHASGPPRNGRLAGVTTASKDVVLHTDRELVDATSGRALRVLGARVHLNGELECDDETEVFWDRAHREATD